MTQQAGNQAIGMAQSAASQPFNLPTAPVAGFTPDQLQSFQQYRDLQGMAQPYYNQAQGYMNSSAQPLTASDINQYYNPMASNVLANLHESQGQQMNDLTGRLTQTAGGVGADRIAVGQAELGRQQNLAEGQTLSGLYQNALGAAQQNKQMQANAGYGLTNLGTTAQGAALQGAGALGQAGNQQQAQQQNVLNAPYQNQLAQLAYPFQTAQYLAGITGGLSGALGGTTSGQGQTTQPAPSIWSQILGGGMAATGALGASGAFGNNGWLGNAFGTNAAYGNGNGEFGGSSTNPLPGLSPDDYGVGYAAGGSAGMGNPTWMDAADQIVPDIQQAQSQANSGAKLDLNPRPSQQQSSGSGGIGSLVGMAAQLAPMFLSQGGAVDPNKPWQGYADGGGPYFDDRFRGSNELTGMFMGDGADQSFNAMPPPNFDERFNSAATMGAMPRGQALSHYPTTDIGPNSPLTPEPAPQPAVADSINPNDPVRMPAQEDVQAWRNGVDQTSPGITALANEGALPSNASPAQGARESLGPPNPKTMASGYASLANPLPYPDLDPSNDTSRGFAKSPWLALLNAGAATMAGTSPFAGVNIGKGLQSGTETLQQQRKDLATEEGVNQRAKQLMQAAEFHLDQYNKMTPYQQAQTDLEKQKIEMQKSAIEQKGWVMGSENPVSGVKTWMKPATGEVRILNPDGTMLTGNINDPSSFKKTGASGKDTPLPKDEQPPPPMGAPELASDLKPTEGNVNTSMYRKGSPALTQANKEMQVQTALNAKEAQAAGASQMLLDETKKAYGVLMKDADKDGFLTKIATMRGNNFDERVRYARSINEAARAAGKPPVVDPEKLAAAEVISKVQNTMGMMFASNISSREAWAGQQAGIASTPGLTQSPLGMLHLISTYDAMNQYGRDKRNFFNNYIQKYGVPTGWEQDFAKKNPIERYLVRATMENLPNRRASEKLPEAVDVLRKNKTNPDVVKKFNQIYGNTASYWLNGKLDMLGAQ